MKPRRTGRRRTARRQSGKAHHNVYVILLKEEVSQLRQVIAENPNRNPSKPCVYVGMTGLNPDERFQNHLKGVKSSYYVKHYAVKLLPELYEFLNPMPYEAALAMERDLAEDLRAEGYTVTGGH